MANHAPRLEGGDASPGAGTRFALEQEGWRESVSGLLMRSENATEEPVHAVASADELLQCGIGDYTYIAGSDGLLGRGKFSTVYKVLGPTGEEYALKHTPLYPHHPLIAARLLREPTLLAEIPPHPCLVGVEGWVRSPSHFYLIETLSRDHVPLSDIRTPISRRAAKKVLDQLVSVVRDGMHEGGRVCHRDLKSENVLIDGKGGLILLDLGLATHFSMSEPRLTTCCGSPAFHSPEIVDALNHPPGSVSYYGPELDIWCIALTLLSLLIDRRYPIGTTHTSLDIMREAVSEALHELDAVLPLEFGDPTSRYWEEDVSEWRVVRRAIEAFLQIDGDARMRAFEAYEVGEGMDKEVRKHRATMQGKAFKSVSFEKVEIKYTLPVQLGPLPTAGEDPKCLTLGNPEGIPLKKVLSYLKYLLRSAGILYHSLSETNSSKTLMQCVLILSPDSPHIPLKRPMAVSNPSFLASIFGAKPTPNRPAPPSPRRSHSTSRVGVASSQRSREHCVRFFIAVEPVVSEGTTSQSTQLPVGLEVESTQHAQRQRISRTVSHDNRTGNSIAGRLPSLHRPQEKPVTALQTRVKLARTASRSRTRSDANVLHERGPSKLWIRLSDARAISAVHKALDQNHVLRSQVSTPAVEKPDPCSRRPDKASLSKRDSGMSRTEYVDAPVQALKDLENAVRDTNISGTRAPPVTKPRAEEQELERGRLSRGRSPPKADRMESPRSAASSPELRTPKIDTGDHVLVVEVEDQDPTTSKHKNKWLRGVWREESMERGAGGYRTQSVSPARVKSGLMMND